MKGSYFAAIGLPRLHLKDEESGFVLDMQVPRANMLEIVLENTHWLLHNGTDDERRALKDLALGITRFQIKP